MQTVLVASGTKFVAAAANFAALAVLVVAGQHEMVLELASAVVVVVVVVVAVTAVVLAAVELPFGVAAP